MYELCNFCQEKVKNEAAVSVQDLAIDKNPGMIKFTDILLDISLNFAVRKFELRKITILNNI